MSITDPQERNCEFDILDRYPLSFDKDGDGGARRDRTDDLMLAKHALYQLSYGPDPG